jgi:hypothetical protein
VCVRYRHCERDAVHVCHGAPGVSRHPGLLHLLVCLRHDGRMSVVRVGRLLCNAMVGASDASGWPLPSRAVAQASMTSHIAMSIPLFCCCVPTPHRTDGMSTVPRSGTDMYTCTMKQPLVFARDARKSRIALPVPGLPLSPSLLLYGQTRPCAELKIWQLQENLQALSCLCVDHPAYRHVTEPLLVTD